MRFQIGTKKPCKDGGGTLVSAEKKRGNRHIILSAKGYRHGKKIRRQSLNNLTLKKRVIRWKNRDQKQGKMVLGRGEKNA